MPLQAGSKPKVSIELDQEGKKPGRPYSVLVFRSSIANSTLVCKGGDVVSEPIKHF